VFFVESEVGSVLRGAGEELRLLTVFLNPEDRRHTLQIGVSIGVPGRRELGLNLFLSHVWLST
jgi:hypothetical protein